MSALVIPGDLRPLREGDQRAKSKEWHAIATNGPRISLERDGREPLVVPLQTAVGLRTHTYVPVRQRPRIRAARSTDTVWRAGAEGVTRAAGGHAHVSNSPATLAGMKRLREA